eukprot:TRINITY_DN9328_c1_g1_i3.p1 TRINITY_DN9328_c1_g1~~TRINITY_DN9328_c1_g1_i3.p1  ORF type:complete len:776 (+),score=145.21 TRINITY_DN9328_c1_g1_i3:62-2389(+)
MADIVKEGWLMKSPPSGVLKGWKTRYFILKRGTTSHPKGLLEYYADKKDVQKGASKGIIDLGTCTAVVKGPVDTAKMRYFFKLNTLQRVYQFSATSELACDEWIQLLGRQLVQAGTSTPVPQPMAAASHATQPAPSPSPIAQRGLPAVPKPAPSMTAPRRTSTVTRVKPKRITKPCAKPSHPRPVGSYPWLYGKISRQVTEDLLRDYGMQQGLFLVRESSQIGAHAISVCHQGRIVHHLVTRATSGMFLLNSEPCGTCTSLEEVIEFLSQAHPPPIKWRSALVQSPLEFDQSVLDPSAARPTSRHITPAQAERTFAANILPNEAAVRLGYNADAPCLLRINQSHITLVDQMSHSNIAGWPMQAVDSLSNTASSITLFMSPNHEFPGTYVFSAALAVEIAGCVRGHSSRFKVEQAKVINRTSVYSAPEMRPPPGAAGVIGAQDGQLSDDEDTANYSWDNVNGGDPSAKPLPPPVGPKASQVVAGVEAGAIHDVLKEQLSLGQQQAQAPPALPRRAPAPEESSTPTVESGKKPALSQIGIAIPGIGLDSIQQARGGLKSAAKAPAPTPESSAVEPTPPPLPARDNEPLHSDEQPVYREVEPQPPVHAEQPAVITQTAQERSLAFDEPEPQIEIQAVGEPWLAGCDYIPDNDSDKLSFFEGDVLTVTQKEDGGWWFARLGGREGWVPADFLDPYELETSDYNDQMDEIVAADMASALSALDNANMMLERHASVNHQRANGVPQDVADSDEVGESYEDMSDAFSPTPQQAVPYEEMNLA